MQDALNNLNRCKELQERALYRSNKDLTATYDMLAKCYATLGRFYLLLLFDYCIDSSHILMDHLHILFYPCYRVLWGEY